jgi:hypothetical protein
VTTNNRNRNIVLEFLLGASVLLVFPLTTGGTFLFFDRLVLPGGFGDFTIAAMTVLVVVGSIASMFWCDFVGDLQRRLREADDAEATAPKPATDHSDLKRASRAKSQREPLVATVRGYSEALELWPENALFWSRLALAQFHQHQAAEAERTLDRAHAIVPRHPEKETTLRSRTVRKLVARGAVVEALRVWGDYQPVTQKDREAHNALLLAGERGWRASTLFANGVPLTVLRREVQLRLSKIGSDYCVEIPDLDVRARAPTPAVGLEKAVGSLREEVQRLIRALPHTLSAAERLRKGMLLGLVDPVTSGLLEGVSAPVWVLGKLVQDGDRLWLEVHEDQRYEVPPSLRVPADGRPHFAQMTAGDAGQPVAPMLKLEAIGSDQPEAVLEAWSKRMS